MHDEFLNQRHGTFFFIAILDGIFFALTVVVFPKVLRFNLNLLRTLPADVIGLLVGALESDKYPMPSRKHSQYDLQRKDQGQLRK
jgi:hypothetical protein